MQHLIVGGVDYKVEPLAIRERLMIPPEHLQQALRHLSSLNDIQEAAILATCNRFDVFVVADQLRSGINQVHSFFEDLQVPEHQQIKPAFHVDENAVAYLCRVASGLESMVLGEGQIMAQVKLAYRNSYEAGCAKTVLQRLFSLALHCGKRVRTRTKIGRGAVSVGAAALELARMQFGTLNGATILIIGAGHAGQMCAKQLLSARECLSVQLINRNRESLEAIRALDVEHKLELDLLYDRRYELVSQADVVIVTTAADDYVLKFNELSQYPRAPRLVIDMSVPRNVDPAIADLKGIQLYTIDDLGAIVQSNLAERASLCDEAESIIAEIINRRWKPFMVRRVASNWLGPISGHTPLKVRM